MSDDLTRHVFKFYIAKALASPQDDQQKITSISEAALDILADVAIHRLTKWAREIRVLLDHSGRTEPNGADVFAVLARYRESMASLGQYIIDKQFTADLQVRDYPLAGGVRFPTTDQQDAFPFRVPAPPGVFPSDLPLPHIPRSFPSPFSDAGIQPEDETRAITVLRRPGDTEAILAAMQEQPPERREEIHLHCPLVDEIVKAVIGEMG
jgi:hypothetical protein